MTNIMENFPVWNKLPSMSPSGLSEDILWRHLLSSGTGGTPAQHAFQEPQWIHINHAGVPTTIEIDRSYLIRALRLRYRDLAAIDPTLPLPAPSVILVRARAIAINLDVGGAIRIIICENQVYVLSVPKASDPCVTALPTENHPFVKWLCRCLKGSTTSANLMLGKFHEMESVAKGGKSTIQAEVDPRQNHHYHDHHHTNQAFDIDMPYELRALEVALTAALGILTAEIDDLEKWGYPAIDCLLRCVDRDTLENVRNLKNGIDKLKEKVQRVVTEIGDLMKDDDDMADLYLARRAEAQGLLPLPQPGEVRDHIDDEIERGAKSARDTRALFDEERRIRMDFVDEFDDDQKEILKEHAAVYEDRAREKKAGEAFDDRQRARHRDQNRNKRVKKTRGEGEEEKSKHRRRGLNRQQGGGTVGHPHRGRRHNFEDIHSDESYSISDSSIDLEDEALSQAEETFLRDQRSLDTGGSFFGAPRVDPHEIEEAEDLLETMFERSDMLLRRLTLLDEQCDDTEELLDLDLDRKRNQLVGLNVVVSAMSMCFGFAAAIGGIFGMNLKNSELDEKGWVLVLVLILMMTGSVVLLLIVLIYMHRKKLMFIPTTV